MPRFKNQDSRVEDAEKRWAAEDVLPEREPRSRRLGAEAKDGYVKYRVEQAKILQQKVMSEILKSHNPEDVLNLKDEFLKRGLEPKIFGDFRMDLPKVNFSGFNLSGCTITAPRLSMADFSNADLRYASIIGCYITRNAFDFSGAKIDGLLGCADEAMYDSLTPDQRDNSYLLFIPQSEYFLQFKLVKKYPNEIDSFGACHGLSREFVRQVMKCRESHKEFKFFQKLNATIDATEPSNFVKRIGHYLATSYLDENYPHFRLTSLDEFLPSLNEALRSAEFLNIVAVGTIDDKPLNHSIVVERCDGGHRVYDTNYGRTGVLDSVEFNRVMNALTHRYGLAGNVFYVTDIGKEVRDRNLLEYKNAYENPSMSEKLDKFGLRCISVDFGI